MRLELKADFPEVNRALDRLSFDLQATVAARAVNRALEQARTDMSREIRREFNLSAAYVRQRLRVRKASTKGGRFGVTAELVGGDGKRRSANVIAFQARQGVRGVTVRIKKSGGRKTIRDAFIGNKGRTVFKRVGRSRLPIEPVRTIDVPQMFNTRTINRAVIKAIEQKLPVIFEREARFALSRFGSRA